MRKLVVFLMSALLGMSLAFAQLHIQDDDGYNHLSTKRIHESDIMYKKTVYRKLDLRELQNQPLFSEGKWISKLVIDAVLADKLTPYATDSLDAGAKLSKEDFIKAITLPDMGDTGDDDECECEEYDDNGDCTCEDASADAGAEYYFPKTLYQMEIKEDLIFDKQRSVMYYDILALTFVVPADNPDNIKGIEIPIASFSYKELVDKVFPNNQDAVWYNPQNDAMHHNLADAFELRMFSSYIVKVSNAEDNYLEDIYGNPKTGIMASQWKAFELLEFEHNLWEF
ncbi:MAG: gliding motility protein GldN [Cytophagales bacterium]|nr:gliding motility protein GldN [Cytophagales bacterium]